MKKTPLTFYSEQPLTIYGGGERIIIELTSYLHSKGYDIEIVNNFNKGVLTRVPEEHILNLLYCPLRESKFLTFGGLAKIYQPMPTIKELNSRDRLAIFFVRRLPPLRYLKEIDKKEIKTIFALHGIALEKIRISHPLIIAHQMIIRAQLIRLAHKTNKNIMVQSLTESVTNYLIMHGALPRNIITIGNSIDPKLYKVGRNDNIFNIIFIGRIENLQKGIKRLLKICRILYLKNPKIRIEIIGIGKDDYLFNQIPPNVKFFGNVDDCTKYIRLKDANLLVITSNLEPFSIVAIEGLFSGIPIVSTPTSGPKEIISKDSEFGKISTFSANDMARDLNEYYLKWESNKTKYFNMKNRISEKGKVFFDKSKMFNLYEELIIRIGD